MKKLQQITKEINELLLKMGQEYPELYQYLDETPDTLPVDPYPVLNAGVLSNYLESLQILLRHHLETRRNN